MNWDMDSVIIRFHLLVAIFAIFGLVANFSWLRLFACLVYALGYGFILLWLNEQNHRAIMYLVSLFGATFALYHAMVWMNEPNPNAAPSLMEQYQYQKQQQQKQSPGASQPKQLPR